MMDWISHVPAEGEHMCTHAQMKASPLRNGTFIARKKLPDVVIQTFTLADRNISAFAHIPDKELYIFPGGMYVTRF